MLWGLLHLAKSLEKMPRVGLGCMGFSGGVVGDKLGTGLSGLIVSSLLRRRFAGLVNKCFNILVYGLF